jgi:hypothetical protein
MNASWRSSRPPERTIEMTSHTFGLGRLGLPGQRDRYRPTSEATELTVIATMTVPNTYEVRA